MLNGLFDIDNRLDYLTENGDMLPRLKELVPREKFRRDLEVIYDHERKSNAGRRPFDVVMMFKILILQSLYNLSDDEMEYQIMDRLSFMRFPDMALDSRVPVSFSEERGESEGGQIPGASAEKRMQRTSVDLMGETREPDKSQDPFRNRTCIGAMTQRAGNLILRSIGISRAEVKLGLRNIAYNMERFCFLMRQTA